MPSSSAARIGPIDGIAHSRVHTLCFLPSTNRSLPLSLATGSQPSDLLVVQPRPPTHSRFSNLCQPLRPMPRSINLLTATGDGPTAIDGLYSGHHPTLIPGDGQIT